MALRQLNCGLVTLIAPSTELSDDSIPEPDITVAVESADKTLQGGNVRIAIEISDSTLAFDLGRKAALYARHAIPEYWVVDLENRVIHLHSAANAEGYADKHAVAFGTAIASVAVPGLIVPTDTLPR
jgi:Uma2 family endonuclease